MTLAPIPVVQRMQDAALECGVAWANYSAAAQGVVDRGADIAELLHVGRPRSRDDHVAQEAARAVFDLSAARASIAQAENRARVALEDALRGIEGLGPAATRQVMDAITSLRSELERPELNLPAHRTLAGAVLGRGPGAGVPETGAVLSGATALAQFGPWWAGPSVLATSLAASKLMMLARRSDETFVRDLDLATDDALSGVSQARAKLADGRWIDGTPIREYVRTAEVLSTLAGEEATRLYALSGRVALDMSDAFEAARRVNLPGDAVDVAQLEARTQAADRAAARLAAIQSLVVGSHPELPASAPMPLVIDIAPAVAPVTTHA